MEYSYIEILMRRRIERWIWKVLWPMMGNHLTQSIGKIYIKKKLFSMCCRMSSCDNKNSWWFYGRVRCYGKFDDWLCIWLLWWWAVVRMEIPHGEPKLAYTIDLVCAEWIGMIMRGMGNAVGVYCIWRKTDI